MCEQITIKDDIEAALQHIASLNKIVSERLKNKVFEKLQEISAVTDLSNVGCILSNTDEAKSAFTHGLEEGDFAFCLINKNHKGVGVDVYLVLIVPTLREDNSLIVVDAVTFH